MIGQYYEQPGQIRWMYQTIEPTIEPWYRGDPCQRAKAGYWYGIYTLDDVIKACGGIPQEEPFIAPSKPRITEIDIGMPHLKEIKRKELFEQSLLPALVGGVIVSVFIIGLLRKK